MFGLGTKEWAGLDSLTVFGSLEDAITKGSCALAKVFCATSVKLEEEGRIKTRFQDDVSEGQDRKASHKRTGELKTRALEPLGELRGTPGGRRARSDDEDPGV